MSPGLIWYAWVRAAVDGVLVRFGEIGIKSQPVRRMMQRRLRDNLLESMLRDSVEGDVVERGARLWMVGADVTALADVAVRTFGVVSATPAREVAAEMEAMAGAAADLALQGTWTTFAVRARRQGKHAFTSQDVGVQVGSAVFEAAVAAGRTPKVSLADPDLEVFIEVRDRVAFVGTQHLPGPGGLPLGSQGRVAVLLSDTPSAVAAWLMMRRGCDVVPVHAGDLGSPPVDLLGPLQRWGLGEDVTVLPVCTGTTTKGALLEAAAQVASEAGASALVTGEGLDSRFLEAPLPVLRPVCGLAPQEVRRIQDLVGLPDEAGDGVLADGGDSAQDMLRLRRVVTV